MFCNVWDQKKNVLSCIGICVTRGPGEVDKKRKALTVQGLTGFCVEKAIVGNRAVGNGNAHLQFVVPIDRYCISLCHRCLILAFGWG